MKPPRSLLKGLSVLPEVLLIKNISSGGGRLKNWIFAALIGNDMFLIDFFMYILYKANSAKIDDPRVLEGRGYSTRMFGTCILAFIIIPYLLFLLARYFPGYNDFIFSRSSAILSLLLFLGMPAFLLFLINRFIFTRYTDLKLDQVYKRYQNIIPTFIEIILVLLLLIVSLMFMIFIVFYTIDPSFK